MTDNKFNFCPECGSKNIRTLNNGRKWQCPDCGFDLYHNVASAVGLIIRDSEGRFLFEQRAKEPRKGYLAFAGGFAEPDETMEEAAVRECREELGVEPVEVKYLCSFPNTYEYKNVVYKTGDMFFEAVLPQNYKFNMDQSEVSSIQWVTLNNKEDVLKAPLAFESAKKTLIHYFEVTQKNGENV